MEFLGTWIHSHDGVQHWLDDRGFEWVQIDGADGGVYRIEPSKVDPQIPLPVKSKLRLAA